MCCCTSKQFAGGGDYGVLASTQLACSCRQAVVCFPQNKPLLERKGTPEPFCNRRSFSPSSQPSRPPRVLVAEASVFCRWFSCPFASAFFSMLWRRLRPQKGMIGLVAAVDCHRFFVVLVGSRRCNLDHRDGRQLLSSVQLGSPVFRFRSRNKGIFRASQFPCADGFLRQETW